MSNLLTTAGALLVIAAVAALTGIWWAVLAAGVFLLVAGYVSRPATETASPTVPAVRPELVKDAA